MGEGGRRSALRPRRRSRLAAAVAGTVMGLVSTGCASTAVSTAPKPATTTVSTTTSAAAGSPSSLTGASLIGSPTGSSVSSPVSSPGAVVAGDTFTAGRLSFRFDRSWSLSTWQVVSTASTSIAYLTAQPTHDPCVTTKIEQGEEVSCSSRVTSLTLGGILISWYYYGLPNTALHFSPGRAVTIAGQPARLASGPPDPTCTRIGGYRSVDATVQPAMANGSPSLLHMDACLTSPVQTAPVLAMLHSLTFTAPPTARSPIRFPSVAVDDPCQPLRNDLYYRQPAGSGALPWSSTVTAARWCEATPGAHGERFTRYQSTGDVSALTRALHAPLTATATHVACTAGPASFPVAVEIIDQHATLFRPTLPVDPCGAISGARRALGVTASRPLAVD